MKAQIELRRREHLEEPFIGGRAIVFKLGVVIEVGVKELLFFLLPIGRHRCKDLVVLGQFRLHLCPRFTLLVILGLLLWIEMSALH